jgi:hypothetical protein
MTLRITPRHLLVLVLAAAAAPFLATGCGSQATVVCTLVCNCENCSSDQEQACVARIEGSEKESSQVGCASQASDYESCYENEGTCIAGVWVVDGCDIEQNAIVSCLAKSNCTVDALGGVHCP